MHVQHTVEIDAPVATVWAVTIALEAWPEWTPTVRAVERTSRGPLGVGTTALVTQTTGDAAEWTVTAFEPERTFTWATRVRGLDVTAAHHLEALPGGRTRNTLRIDGAGPARLLWPVVRGRLLSAITAENEGLKARCEALAVAG